MHNPTINFKFLMSCWKTVMSLKYMKLFGWFLYSWCFLLLLSNDHPTYASFWTL